MDKKNEEQGKKCFIVTPIGNEDSQTFRKAKGVIESTIKPVLQEYGFDDVRPAYEINEPGKIGEQVIQRIINDDLVIANLTGNNPNVMYELAIRQMTGKPVINICESGTNLPFDIVEDRTIFFVNDMLGASELRTKLSYFLNEIRLDKEYTSNSILSSVKERSNMLEISSIQKQITQLNRILEMTLFEHLPVERKKVWLRVCLLWKLAENANEHDVMKLSMEIASKLQEAGYYFDAKRTGLDLFMGELSFVSTNPKTLLIDDITELVEEVCHNHGVKFSVDIIKNH